jgi:hypothetical protein
MALIITNEISTDAGLTSRLYLNIRRIEIIKNSILTVNLNRYLNKESREANEFDFINTRQIPNSLPIDSEEITDLISESAIYPLIYAKVKSFLETAGFTVEDDI